MSTVTCPHASLLHGAMPASHAGDRSSLAPCLICSSRPALPDLNRQRGRGLGCRRAGRIAHVELCKHHVLGPGAVDCLVPPVTHPSCATHASVCTEPPTAAIACSAAKDDDDLLPVHQGSQILCGKLRKRDVPERQGASRSPSRPSVAIDELDALDAYHLPRSPTHPAAFDVDALRANRPDVTPCTSPLVSPVISRASSFQDVSPSDGAGAYERHSILDGTSCIHAASKACACWCLLELRDRVLLLCPFRRQTHDGRSNLNHIQQGGYQGFLRSSDQNSSHTLYATQVRCESCGLLRGYLLSGGWALAHYPSCVRIPRDHLSVHL